MVIKHNSEQYTWIPAFRAIADWIVDYEDKQEELVNILAKTGIIKGLEDEYIEDKKEALKEIDPFTFFAAFMKFGVKNREKLIGKLINVIGKDISLPKDFDGVPTAQALKFWLFPYKYIRSDDSIPLLWELFRQARNGDIKEQDFNSALKILGTGFTKLTQYLFYINPSQYLPIDAQTEPWLEQQGFTLPQESWSDYQNLLESLKVKTDMPFWQISYEAWYENTDKKVASQQSGYNIKSKSKEPNMANLNRILYGPPGTGKTYKTTELAVQCVAPDWYYELNNEYLDEPDRRKLIKAKYDELTVKGRIAFTTFHQSFAYEDFVEGIRAETIKDEDNKSNISYAVKNGIFKEIANAAAGELIRNNLIGISQEPNVWKISLGQRYETEFRKKCIEAGEARIGWENTGNLNINFNNRSKDEKEYFLQQSFQKQNSITNFCEGIQVGDIILCLETRTSIEAIGIVTSEYIYNENASNKFSGYPHVREVNWFVSNISLDIRHLNNGKSLEINTCVPLPNLSWINLLEELESHGYLLNEELAESSILEDNYVLIIDEINRGNISRIFGELITLLEPDKRKGGRDARKVILPYSKSPFSVPSNLYVLGTMNTADKSLVQLDLALRRRFDFIELLPKPELLDGITVYGIAVSEVLTVINQRIEVLLDREYTIGHSYFWSLKDLDSDDEKEIELGNIFKRRIIPLLQEYFFSDWERIGWVLNDPAKDFEDRFIQTEKINPTMNQLFPSKVLSQITADRRYYINADAFSKPQAYKGIFHFDTATGEE